MFTSSPQEKIIFEFIKMSPFTYAWFVILCYYLNDRQMYFFLFSASCSWVPCLSWTVQLSHKSHEFFSFPAFLCIWTLWVFFFNPILNPMRDSFATITEDSNTHWCSRRKKHALRARAWKLLNRMKMCVFFLFCLHIIFFHLVLPFRSYRR